MTTRPAISRIHIEGFRSLKKIDLEPGRVTVLIGPNGSGKSNLLAALRMIAMIRQQSLGRFVTEAGGASTLLHYGPKFTPEIRIELELAGLDRKTWYNARLAYSGGDTLRFAQEHVRTATATHMSASTMGSGGTESRLHGKAASGKSKAAAATLELLSGITFYHFHDTSLASPLRLNSRQEDTAQLRSDGSNLAAFLLAMKSSDHPSRARAWRRIEHLVQRIAPYIKRLQPTLVDPAHPTRSAVRLDWVDTRDYTFGSHQLSDGTLRCIALFAALGQPLDTLPAFMTIDEPELGLHPAALTLFAGLLRSVASHAQVVLSTQSPALLDLFEPQEVVVTELVEGTTTLSRLDPDRLEKWLEDYTLSELFDKNLLGGRP